MIIEKLTVGPFQSNCFIVGCEKTRESIVIDPGDEAERIVKQIKQKDLNPIYILLTHAHIDHVRATQKVQEQSGGITCLHKKDLFLFENLAMQASLFNLPPPSTAKIDQFIEEGDYIKFGEYRIEVLYTPGHSPGGVSFFLKEKDSNRLFSGDTLFWRSIGRTDLWGGDYNQIIKSIREKLLPLGDKTIVYTGHGPDTTIKEERMANPFLT